MPNITGQLEDFDGDQLTHGQLVVEFYGETSRPVGSDVRLGHEVYEIKDLTSPLTLDAGSYTFTVISRRLNSNGNGPRPTFETQKWSYDLVADTTWATIRTEGGGTPPAISGTVATLLAEMEGIRDAQEEIAGLTGEDAAVAALHADPDSLTGNDLRQNYVGAVVARGAGIDPTGVINSHTALQAKITSAAAFGARVHIPAGTYKLDTRLDVASNTKLVGDGHDTVLNFTFSGGGATWFRNTGHTGAGNNTLRFENLTIKGQGDGNPVAPPAEGEPGPGAGLYLRYVNNVEIVGVRFYRVPGVAISIQGASRVRVLNSPVEECGRGGIVITGYSTTRMFDVVIANSPVRGVGDDGIAVNCNSLNTAGGVQGSKVAISNSPVHGSDNMTDTHGGGRGILVQGVADVAISNCPISSTFGSGIYVVQDDSATIRSKTVAISNCPVTKAGYPGAGSPPAQNGILVANADEVTITGSPVTESAHSGIEVTNAVVVSLANSPTIRCGNTLDDHGIFINTGTLGLVSDVTITGCQSKGSAGSGIRVRNGDRVTITGSPCTDNGRAGSTSATSASGITLFTAGTVTITGSPCTDTRTSGKTQLFGISTQSATGALILQGCNLLGNGTTNLNLVVAPTVLVTRGVLQSTTTGANYDQDASGARHRSGAGTPEGIYADPVGSTYRRTDGGGGTTLYVKEFGTGASGWQSSDPTASTAQLTSLTAPINTAGKYAGKSVWNTSTGRMVWAANAAAADVWRYNDGTTAHTPV